MILLYLLTPTLGLARNYIKYKRCSFLMYLRTPLVYVILHSLFFMLGSRNIVLKTLILERWYWFVEKSIRSYRNDDYHKKKEKYKIKHNVTYD